MRWGQIKRKLGINQDTPRKPPSTPSARSPATGRGPAVPASSPSVLSATPGSVAGVRKPAAGRRPGAKKPGPKPKVKPEVHEDEDLAVGDIPQKPARQKPGPKPRQPAAQPSPRRAVTPAPAEEEDDGREDEGEGNVVRRQYLDMQQTPLPGILGQISPPPPQKPQPRKRRRGCGS